ncbi:MAG: hypothetical protein ACSHXY_07740 [Alphaproteobacteria bacterium]
MLQLAWVKSLDSKWLNLSHLDLTHVHATGIYIIWHGGENPRIVRIGHGNIASRLTEHKLNLQIMRYKQNGPLMVTWAEMADETTREGAAHYLAKQFSPLVKDRPSDTAPIVARSPFA